MPLEAEVGFPLITGKPLQDGGRIMELRQRTGLSIVGRQVREQGVWAWRSAINQREYGVVVYDDLISFLEFCSRYQEQDLRLSGRWVNNLRPVLSQSREGRMRFVESQAASVVYYGGMRSTHKLLPCES